MRSLRTATKSSPRSPQLEKARVQQLRPNTAKNKIKNKIKFIKKKKKNYCPINDNKGTSLAVQWLRLCTSTAGDVSLIPGGGTKIPWPKDD